MIRSIHLLAFGLVVFVGLAFFGLPAASVIGLVGLPPGLAVSSVDGPVWNMRLSNVAYRGRAIGHAYVEPGIGILFGGFGGKARLEGPTVNASFDFQDKEGLLLNNMDLTAQLYGRLASQSFSGAARVVDGDMSFDAGGRCVSASGELRTNAFEDMFAGIGIGRDPVITPLACKDGVLSVDFERNFSGGTLVASGQLRAANNVEVGVTLRFDDQAAIPEQIIGWLEANGFSATVDGWQTSTTLVM